MLTDFGSIEKIIQKAENIYNDDRRTKMYAIFVIVRLKCKFVDWKKLQGKNKFSQQKEM